MSKVIVGGHRGSGCTDSPHAKKIGQEKPAENTIESIQEAIRNGAKLIEIDVIQTKDNRLVVTHSNQLSDHVFNVEEPGLVSEYTLDKLKGLDVGPKFNGTIPELKEVLNVTQDITLNIEIKDVKGTDDVKQLDDRPMLVDLLAEELKGYEGDTILSSFSLWDLQEMSKRLPDSNLAILFDTAEKEERPIYGEDCPDQSAYLQFTPENVKAINDEVDIEYVHPCIDSVNETNINICSELGLGVNTWALDEPLPEQDHENIENLVFLCNKKNVQLGLITDYTPEMLRKVKSLENSPSIQGSSKIKFEI